MHFVFVFGPLGVAAYKRKVLEENSARIEGRILLRVRSQAFMLPAD